MKYILLSVLVLSLLCCNMPEETYKLNRVIEMFELSPDSSRKILASIKDPYTLNYKNFAHWCMLTSQIADKLKEQLPSVQDLIRAKEWYIKHGKSKDQAQIGLYLARAFMENQEHEQAMKEYLQALDIAKRNKHYNLTGYICTYMADLYLDNNDIRSACEKYKEAAGFFKKGNNVRSYTIAYRDMGRAWAIQDSFALALYCLYMADSIIANINDPEVGASILNYSGNIYSLQGNLNKAEKYLLAALHCDTTNDFYNHNVRTELYIQKGELNKAQCLLDSLSYLHLYEKLMINIYYNYYLLYKKKNNSSEALLNLENFITISDKLLLERKDINFIEMEKKYNQLKYFTENQRLKIDRQYYMISLISLVILLLTGFIIFQRRQLYLKKKIIKQEKDLNDYNIQCYQLTIELERKKNMLDSAVIKQNENEEIKKEMLLLQEQFKNIKRTKLLNSEIGKKLDQLASVNIPQNNKPLITYKKWQAIEKEVTQIYPDFYDKLHNLSPNINVIEWRYCCLVLFNFTSKQLAILLNINPESVRKRNLRIKQKLGIALNNSTLYNYFIDII